MSAPAQRPVGIEGHDLLEPDLAGGIASLESRREPAERRAFGGEDEADAQQPADGARQLAGVGQGVIQGRQCRHQAALEPIACGREADPAAGPVEDLHAEPGLKDPYRLAHPGLGDAQALSGPTEVQLIGDLLAGGQRVRALVRAGESAGTLPAGAEAVTGDLADEGSLVTAMEGVEKVFLLSSPHSQAVSRHRNAIDAARRTQVQLLVRSGPGRRSKRRLSPSPAEIYRVVADPAGGRAGAGQDVREPVGLVRVPPRQHAAGIVQGQRPA
jgi:NAD(P)H-binding